MMPHNDSLPQPVPTKLSPASRRTRFQRGRDGLNAFIARSVVYGGIGAVVGVLGMASLVDYMDDDVTTHVMPAKSSYQFMSAQMLDAHKVPGADKVTYSGREMYVDGVRVIAKVDVVYSMATDNYSMGEFKANDVPVYSTPRQIISIVPYETADPKKTVKSLDEKLEEFFKQDDEKSAPRNRDSFLEPFFDEPIEKEFKYDRHSA